MKISIYCDSVLDAGSISEIEGALCTEFLAEFARIIPNSHKNCQIAIWLDFFALYKFLFLFI
jgi:hypothetical protein